MSIVKLQWGAEITVRRAALDRARARSKRQGEIDSYNRQYLAATAALAESEMQKERAAYALVKAADRKYNETDLTESAIADYRSAAKLYVGTKWGRTAREKLQKIEGHQKGNLL